MRLCSRTSRRDVEVFFDADEPVRDDALDRVHRERPDPWHVDSDYERRKRAVTLASLPRDRYERALEVGCSVGALAVDLAERCDALLAIDSSETAIAAARDRTATSITSRSGAPPYPTSGPTAASTSSRISEVGYFLSPRQLAEVVERSLAS